MVADSPYPAPFGRGSLCNAGASRAWFGLKSVASAVGTVLAITVCVDVVTPPKLLDLVRQAIRVRHYSRRTEEAYVHWIRRYIVFHRKRHPSEMGATDISQFLTSLAVDRHVSASTQNQALSALLFLYKRVLGTALGPLD